MLQRDLISQPVSAVAVFKGTPVCVKTHSVSLLMLTHSSSGSLQVCYVHILENLINIFPSQNILFHPPATDPLLIKMVWELQWWFCNHSLLAGIWNVCCRFIRVVLYRYGKDPAGACRVQLCFTVEVSSPLTEKVKPFVYAVFNAFCIVRWTLHSAWLSHSQNSLIMPLGSSPTY